MQQAGVADVRDVKPAELSYGAQRRVEIARAMAMQPRILLLDEPTAGMNQAERESVSELLKQLRSEKVAQLLVEHDVQMMVDTCDLLYAMNAGTLIAEGTPHSVVTDPGVQKAYLERNGPSVLSIENLHVAYGKVEAVRGVSLTAVPGQITLVLGVNGAGKTTTLRATAACCPWWPGRSHWTASG